MAALKCSCGQLSRRVKFDTFEYQFCDACKKEVTEETPKTIEWPAITFDDTLNDVFRYVTSSSLASRHPQHLNNSCADVGETVSCAGCGTGNGTLVVNLPMQGPPQRLTATTFWKCSTPCKCSIGLLHKHDPDEAIHIRYRGWVKVWTN